jgi:hypothetical protein
MPRKTVKQQKSEKNRIKSLVKDLYGTESAEDLMLKIRNVLKETTNTPQAGNFYTFAYRPKTPRMRYDAHPLVAVTNVYSWGFSGINFHWGEQRQYTFEEVLGSLHFVNKNEVEDLRRIPYGQIKINS